MWIYVLRVCLCCIVRLRVKFRSSCCGEREFIRNTCKFQGTIDISLHYKLYFCVFYKKLFSILCAKAKSGGSVEFKFTFFHREIIRESVVS